MRKVDNPGWRGGGAVLTLFGGHDTLKGPPLKVCFLSSGWPKVWPVGRTQYLFFFLFFFGKKIVRIILKKTICKNEKRKVHNRPLYTHPAATVETTFFKAGQSVRSNAAYFVS